MTPECVVTSPYRQDTFHENTSVGAPGSPCPVGYVPSHRYICRNDYLSSPPCPCGLQGWVRSPGGTTRRAGSPQVVPRILSFAAELWPLIESMGQVADVVRAHGGQHVAPSKRAKKVSSAKYVGDTSGACVQKKPTPVTLPNRDW